MPDERHEQDDDSEDVIRQLRARVDECEAERARLAAAAMSENSRLRAEVAMLAVPARRMLWRLLGAQEQAAGAVRGGGPGGGVAGRVRPAGGGGGGRAAAPRAG